MAAGVAGVNFVCTFIGLFLVERVGRKRLLLGSLVGVILSLGKDKHFGTYLKKYNISSINSSFPGGGLPADGDKIARHRLQRVSRLEMRQVFYLKK